MPQMRLDKFIASQTRYSRSNIKALVKAGRVAINGVLSSRADEKLNPETDVVTLDGETVAYQSHVVYQLNKPKGVVSATTDKHEKTVLDLVPEELRRPGLFAIGRLDKDTTGLLLLSDDGALSHQILSPKKKVEKLYLATLDRVPQERDLNKLRQGVILKDGTNCLPAVIEKTEENQVWIAICEGKYHQIKRMFSAVGYRVEALKRLRIGGLKLDAHLREGEMRPLENSEISSIFL